jgi:hypothetical protein
MHAKACAAGSTRFASTGRAEKPKAEGGWLIATGDNVHIHCALFLLPAFVAQALSKRTLYECP